MLCLNILLARLSVLEELAAIHAIVCNAGETLVEHTNMELFLAELKVRALALGIEGDAEGKGTVLGGGAVRERARAMYEVRDFIS